MEMALFIILWLTALAFASYQPLGIWLHAHIVVLKTEMETYLEPNSFLRKLLAPLE